MAARNSKRAVNSWLIAFVVSFATLMEVIDTSFVNIALPNIAGTLGVSNGESIWVLTSYLVSSAVVVPITSWLVLMVGRRKLFVFGLFLFAIGSLSSGIAHTLGILLLSRVIQGIGGGFLIPLAQAVLADVMPIQQRGLAFAVYGLMITLAPVIGPVLGGWVCDLYSWRLIFFVNLPVVVPAIIFVLIFVDDPPYVQSARPNARLDSIGFGLLASGAGLLQVALDKWQVNPSFQQELLRSFAIVAVVVLVALVIRELRVGTPVIDIRLFRNVNFRISSLMMFVAGASSVGTTVLMAQFLQNQLGYTAENGGIVLSAAAIVLLAEMPFVGLLTSRIQVRYLLAFGWGTFAIGMFLSARMLNADLLFGSAIWLRIAQYAPFGFIFIPLTTVAYQEIPMDKTNAIAGLINLARGLGTSLGTAAIGTILAQRAMAHLTMLTRNPAPAMLFTTQLQRSNGESQLEMHHRIYLSILDRAASLSYADIFRVLSFVATAMFLLSFVLRKNTAGSVRAGLSQAP